MLFTIPILVEERSSEILQGKSFLARPLFFERPLHRAEKLSRALTKLSGDLHQLLHELGQEPRHDGLAAWAFNPELEETTLDVRLELKSGSQLRRFFLVGYPALGRKLFFTPALPELHFEVFPGQKVLDRATAVLTQHFRQLEREGEPLNLDEIALGGKARITTLEIDLKLLARAKKRTPPRRAFIFGGEEKKDGEQELRKVGRCLQQLYPDDLERAVGRDAEVNELARLLAASDRRPIALIGRRKTGKTVILHELVWQACQRKKENFAGRREIWAVSPMRLISGMSYLGEWENRVLAILDHAREKDRVLYFDDLLGLFTAGVSSASDLNVAEVLRPVLEKRTVRVIGEITPEAWRVLRERNRAFADLFHVIPIAEPPEPETLRILMSVSRRLEEQHGCQFNLEVLPTVYELHRRFAADAAFPGKAAGFLRRLAASSGPGKLKREHVLEQFHEESGLNTAFVDVRQRLEHAGVMQALGAGLVGQTHVLEEFADILLALNARLNDPRRPLGTLLLLGPTGVGKTQSAKTLARFLFGNEDRLIRFDMNEYVEGYAASRLVGTPEQPEGLLTGAIRRQPFSVVLFDEIEKAAPEVFDVLLAVLDEGRLADALGRVADFTNAFVLLTSNLGVREARSRLGFDSTKESAQACDSIFVEAAEKFFRPEFFNRLDRVIPFRALETVHLEGIARQLIANVFTRDGLRRRDCILRISPRAVERLVELGREPHLGARALKRVVERELVMPLAERLAVLSPGTPSIAGIGREGNHLTLHLRELLPAARSVFWAEAAAQAGEGSTEALKLINSAQKTLNRISNDLEKLSPAGPMELTKLPPAAQRYFACREQVKKIERLLQAAMRSQSPSASRKASPPARLPKARPNKFVVRQYYSGNPHLGRQREMVSLQVELGEWEASESVEVPESPLLALCREMALLQALAHEPWDDRPMVFVFEPLEAADARFAFALGKLWHDYLAYLWGGTATCIYEHLTPEERLLRELLNQRSGPHVQGVFATGLNLRQLWTPGPSSVLLRRGDGTMGLLLVHALDAQTEGEARVRTETFLKANPKAQEIPQAIGPVVQMFAENKTLTDFRTGLVVPAEASPEEFRAMMLSALPLPEEMEPS